MTAGKMAMRGNIKKDAPVNYALDFRAEIEKRTNGKSVDCMAYFENSALYIENSTLPRPYAIKSQSVSSITFYLNSAFAYTEVIERDAETEEVVSFLLYVPVETEEEVFAFRELFNDLSAESGCEVNEIIDENPFFVSDDEREDDKTAVPLPTDIVDGADEALENIKTLKEGFSSEEEQIDSALRAASIPVASDENSEPVTSSEDDEYSPAAFEAPSDETVPDLLTQLKMVKEGEALPQGGIPKTVGSKKKEIEYPVQENSNTFDALDLDNKYEINVEVDSEKSAATRDQLLSAMSKSNISDASKIAGLATKLAHSTEQGKKYKAELQKLSAKYAQLQESTSQIRASLDEKNRKNDDLMRELRFEKEATAKAKKFVEDARQEMSNVITKSEYNIALANKRAENAEKKTEEHDAARIKAEIALDEANKDYAQKTIELNAKYQEFEDALKVTEYEKRVAARTVEEVSKKLEEFSSKAIKEIALEHDKVVELETKLDEKELEIAQGEENYNTLKGQFEGLEQEKARIDEEYVTTTENLKLEYENRIDELHKQIINLEYDNNQLADAHRADEEFRMQFAEQHEGTLAQYISDIESKDAELASMREVLEAEKARFEETATALRAEIENKASSIVVLEEEKQAILDSFAAEAEKQEPIEQQVFSDDETLEIADGLISQHLLIYDFMDKINEIVKGKGKLKKAETERIIVAANSLLEEIDDDVYQRASDMIDYFNDVQEAREAAMNREDEVDEDIVDVVEMSRYDYSGGVAPIEPEELVHDEVAVDETEPAVAQEQANEFEDEIPEEQEIYAEPVAENLPADDEEKPQVGYAYATSGYTETLSDSNNVDAETTDEKPADEYSTNNFDVEYHVPAAEIVADDSVEPHEDTAYVEDTNTVTDEYAYDSDDFEETVQYGGNTFVENDDEAVAAKEEPVLRMPFAADDDLDLPDNTEQVVNETYQDDVDVVTEERDYADVGYNSYERADEQIIVDDEYANAFESEEFEQEYYEPVDGSRVVDDETEYDNETEYYDGIESEPAPDRSFEENFVGTYAPSGYEYAGEYAEDYEEESEDAYAAEGEGTYETESEEAYVVNDEKPVAYDHAAEQAEDNSPFDTYVVAPAPELTEEDIENSYSAISAEFSSNEEEQHIEYNESYETPGEFADNVEENPEYEESAAVEEPEKKKGFFGRLFG